MNAHMAAALERLLQHRTAFTGREQVNPPFGKLWDRHLPAKLLLGKVAALGAVVV